MSEVVQPPPLPPVAEPRLERRHDVDWLRTYALGLLIIYHVAVSFQPWAKKAIFFPQNEETLEWVWIILSALNVWRIPILFLVSGMGVRFAMERRNWKGLLKDRSLRILVPLLFGTFFICPITVYFNFDFYGKDLQYLPNPGHLWFLGNIFFYVLLFLPLFSFWRKRPDNRFFLLLRRMLKFWPSLFLFAIPLIISATVAQPDYFASYAFTFHGLLYGFFCFGIGFVFVSLRESFWQAVEKIRFLALGLALLSYLVRLLIYELEFVPVVLEAFESTCWMLAVLGLGSRHLNRPSATLSYLSRSVYPVYILHMPVQAAMSNVILPLDLPAIFKLLLLVISTFGLSFLIYELIVQRINWLRPLFGMKLRHRPKKEPILPGNESF